jgi:putative glutathione S-transferase
MVNNESAEIIRFLNSDFNEWAKNPSLDLYPEPLRKTIDEINIW